MPATPDHPNTISSLKKPDLILVHGFRGSPIGLAEIAKSLRAAGYSVHTPAIPPFAGTPALPDYTPESYADFLADYVKSHHLDHPIFIGHSMGSIIVAAALDRHPQVFNRRAVLLSPIAKRTALPLRIISPLSAILPRRAIDDITTLYLFVPKDKDLRQKVLAATHDCSNDRPPKKSQVFRAAQFSTRYAISDFPLKQNVLLIAGEKDRIMSQKSILTLAENLQADVKFLPNSGHLHNYEQPIETAELILDFLQDS